MALICLVTRLPYSTHAGFYKKGRKPQIDMLILEEGGISESV